MQNVKNALEFWLQPKNTVSHPAAIGKSMWDLTNPYYLHIVEFGQCLSIWSALYVDPELAEFGFDREIE